MNDKFADWVVATTKKYKPDIKRNLLEMLKFAPDQALAIIASNLVKWGTDFCLETGNAVRITPGDSTANTILSALQKHYDADLVKITEIRR